MTPVALPQPSRPMFFNVGCHVTLFAVPITPLPITRGFARAPHAPLEEGQAPSGRLHGRASMEETQPTLVLLCYCTA